MKSHLAELKPSFGVLGIVLHEERVQRLGAFEVTVAPLAKCLEPSAIAWP